MPQMSPMSWILISPFSVILVFMILSMIYFTIICVNTKNTLLDQKKNNSMNMKW